MQSFFKKEKLTSTENNLSYNSMQKYLSNVILIDLWVILKYPARFYLWHLDFCIKNTWLNLCRGLVVDVFVKTTESGEEICLR